MNECLSLRIHAGKLSGRLYGRWRAGGPTKAEGCGDVGVGGCGVPSWRRVRHLLLYKRMKKRLFVLFELPPGLFDLGAVLVGTLEIVLAVVKLSELAVVLFQGGKRDLVLCNLFLHALYFLCFASHFESTLCLLKRVKGDVIFNLLLWGWHKQQTGWLWCLCSCSMPQQRRQNEKL